MQNDRLKQLAGQFLQRTRQELLALDTLLPSARAGQAESLLELQRLAHRINGSGALLGFTIISEHARQVERILRRAEPAPTAAEWQIIVDELQAIDREVTDAAADSAAE